jgi:hypothetical protein
MKPRIIITSAIALLLLPPLAYGQRNEPAENNQAAQPLPTDVILGHGYVKRNGAIHFIGGGMTGVGANATRIDMPSPALLKKVVDSQFGPFKTAEGLDVASFEALSEEYTRDKNRVYFKVISPGEFIVRILPDADPATFNVLATHIARDKNHVWYYDRIQPGADPASLVLVDGGQVFKDKDSVHYGYDKIAGADPASFRHIGSAYYADKNRVYWCTDPIADADPATFEVLDDSFVATDKTSVYRSGEPLRGSDVATTKLILDDPYGYQILSDKNGLHLNGMTFPRSKPGDVEVIDNLTVKGGDLVYTVDRYQSVPVTLFKENGKLMAETLAYEPGTRKPQGTITAEVTPDGLKGIRIAPLPGGKDAPSVPEWRMDVFKRPDLIQQMNKAGKHIQ